MSHLRIFFGVIVQISLVFCALVPNSIAADYPQKNINLITPYGPGGASDLAGRAFAESLSKYIDKTIMVINKEGAGGIIGSQWVRQQRKDGYNLLIARIGSQVLAPVFNPKNPFKWNQFTMLGILQIDPVVLLVKADSPYKDLKSLLDAIAQNPGKISYSASGPFTLLALAPQLLLQQANIDPKAAKMVPYKGGGAAMTALLGGHVDFLAGNYGESKSQIEAKSLIPIAATDTVGIPDLADVPKFKDLGYEKMESLVGWTGLYGPENLPEPIVSYWANMLQQIAKDPQWQDIVRRQGCIPNVLSPEATQEFIQNQINLYENMKKTLMPNL